MIKLELADYGIIWIRPEKVFAVFDAWEGKPASPVLGCARIHFIDNPNAITVKHAADEVATAIVRSYTEPFIDLVKEKTH